MKARTVPPHPPKNKTTAILRLERINSDLLSLRDNLKSYTCEPKTHGLFEKREAINNELEGLRSSNQELIKFIKSTKRGFEDRIESISARLIQFRELERTVLEYIGMAKMHC